MEELLERLRKQLGDDSPIAMTSRQGREGTHVVFTVTLNEQGLGMLLDTLTKVMTGSEAMKKASKTMQEFTKEFAKGMDKWAKSLKGKNPFGQD